MPDLPEADEAGSTGHRAGAAVASDRTGRPFGADAVAWSSAEGEGEPTRVRRRLLRWFGSHGRDFFWRRGELTRFQVLLVEFLLWKTSAAHSHGLILELAERYPEPGSVLKRSVAQLEAELRPLGLQRRRAACLRSFSEQLIERHGGRVPSDLAALLKLKGIGQYAARATLCVLDDSTLMPVDANSSRLFGRLFALEGPGVRTPGPVWDARLAPFVPRRRPRRFLWAVMDLCAAHCRARRPSCEACPLRSDCATGRESAGV